MRIKKMDETKVKALDSVLVQIEKQYGKGAIMKLGQTAGDSNIEVLPTGCLSLDLAIGVGGLPGILSMQPQSMVTFAIAMLIAVAVPFVLTVVVGKKKLQK